MTSARPSPAARARERLAEAESDLARNRVEARWIGRLALGLPALGAAAGGVVWLTMADAVSALVVVFGTLATAVVTFATGAYMIAMRRREFEEAIRDARAAIARLEAGSGAPDAIEPGSDRREPRA